MNIIGAGPEELARLLKSDVDAIGADAPCRLLGRLSVHVGKMVAGLLDVAAVLVVGGGADAGELAPGQGRAHAIVARKRTPAGRHEVAHPGQAGEQTRDHHREHERRDGEEKVRGAHQHLVQPAAGVAGRGADGEACERRREARRGVRQVAVVVLPVGEDQGRPLPGPQGERRLDPVAGDRERQRGRNPHPLRTARSGPAPAPAR